jgi:hypothetical protein
MWRVKSQFQHLRSIVIVVATVCAPLMAAAQDVPRDQPSQAPATAPAKAPQPYGGGSPLNVLMHTKLWEDPPTPKPFVTESREPLDTLSYQPTAGDDTKRAKPLSAKQLEALQGALENAGAHNEKAGGVKDKKFADYNAIKRREDKREKLEGRPIRLHRHRR